MSAIEDVLLHHIRSLGIKTPEREYRFHDTRRWRFDFAWPDIGLAVEVEGGTWTKGRHTTGAGFEKDAEKYNEAALLGWTILRFTSGMVRSGVAVQKIEAAMNIDLMEQKLAFMSCGEGLH